MDFYLDENNQTSRLIKEWNEYGKIIIAYDFDDTVYDYHKKGRTFRNVINLLQECKKQGAYFIVFTACDKNKFDFIKKYLKINNIPFDKINEQAPFVPFSGRKIYYNILLDDRAGLPSSYRTLKDALTVIKKQENKV